MKKLILCVCLLVFASSFVDAQVDYNRWSLEINGGFNKAMAPMTPGYLSPTLNIGHADFGVRYMINEKFGLKGDLGFGQFNEAEGNSPSFETNYFRMHAQGVMNIGRVLNWESFTRTFGLLLHAGPGYGRVDYITGRFNQPLDEVYSFIAGFTGQVKLSERIALTGDISMIHHGRQTYAFDGNSYNTFITPQPTSNPFVHAPGTWWSGTLGLNFYLGNKASHADWYIAADKYATKEELATQIGEIKDMLKDSDGDGVPDYLEKEPNTASGGRVDAQGRTLDSDGDGIPDHLDKCPFAPGPADGCPIQEVKEIDYFKKAINENYVNVYFAFDSSKPLGYSISSTNFAANFLKRNPGVNLEIKGYADELGPEDYNMKLSEKRAKAVYDLMISAGIDASRLSYKGYGEDTSVDKASDDARQLARRVSFEVK